LIRRFHFIWLLALLLLGFAPAAEEKRLAIYSPQTGFTVPVIDHDGHEYVSITDLLDPFGQASLKKEGKRWRLRFEGNGKTVEGEFRDGSAEAKIHGKKIALGQPFWSDNQRGYIPVPATPFVMSNFVPGSATLRGSSRRLFLGDVSTTFSADLEKGAPSQLALRFSAPVNPSVATEPGRVRLTFTHEPLVAAFQSQLFDDPQIRSAAFSEANGGCEIDITTAAPVTAAFSDGNRTITLRPVQTQATTPAITPSQPATTTPTASLPLPPATPAIPTPPRFLVTIDPAHGGTDSGAALGGGLLEKDLTLAIARRLRSELDQRGIGAVLTREGDTTLTSDQRAATANASRSGVYIAIHVDSLGSGIRLYTSRLAPAAIPANAFLPWDSAQSSFLDKSHNLVAAAITEFDKRRVRAIPLETGLRPLRNVAKPAIAAEIAPPPDSTEGLATIAYQQAVASALAAALATQRSALEVSP
jgi:N-acetylmuramoyl-L-alanine amidase